MLNARQYIQGIFIGVGLLLCALPAAAADTDALTKVLSEVDARVCTSPKDIQQFYSKNLVIMFDDKRVMLENRIEDYESMMSDLVGLKCTAERTVLSSGVGDKSSFMAVDETASVTSQSGHIDERQHSFCTYGFVKEGGAWKIAHEHCSSLPDYTIVPGDDALYYFHNPVY
ncbi:MAG: nuclear transport factor 2 family protein [Nitrospina sp.]|nr:nuclear transport factor 2 family protein [Nitrospina sp.]